MINYKYLTRAHTKGFDHYKYNAIDSSPFGKYVMHPFWNKMVEFLPEWLAPNLITLIGFLFVVANFLLLTYYDYYYFASSALTSINMVDGEIQVVPLYEPIPQYLWLICGAFLFLAYNLDGMDGKQARKIRVSGPLGEMFDHGLDSYVVFFIPICLYSIFGRLDYSISPLRMYFITWSIVFNFYVSHVEKYNTGCLFLPWSYDLSMWGSTLLFIVAGVKGVEHFRVDLPAGFKLANLMEIITHTTGPLTTVPMAIYNVILSNKQGTGKMRSFSEAIRPAWAILTIFVALTFWAVLSPTNILDQDPRMFFLLFGTLFSSVSCRLIVSQMSNQRCDAVNWLFWPLCAAVGLSFLDPQRETTALYLINSWCLLAHIHYGTCVVRQLCKHFRVNCFKVSKKIKK